MFKDNPDALSIFIIADREARIKRIAQKEGVDEKTAAKFIEKTDAARDNFTKTFAGTSRYDARNYDITLNVRKFGVNGAVDFLMNVIG